MNPARMACASMRCLSWRWRWPALRGRLLAIALANAAGGVLFAIIVAQAADMNRYGLSVVAAAVIGLVLLALAELRLAREAGREAFVA